MKRYTPSVITTDDKDQIITMVERPDGAYVSHADISPLLHAAMKLSAALRLVMPASDFADGALHHLNEELERLL